MQSLLYFSDENIAEHSDDDAAGYVATMAALPIIDDIDPTSASSIKSAMDLTYSGTSGANKPDAVQAALSVVFSNPATDGIVDCDLVTNMDEICNPHLIDDGDDGDADTPDIGIDDPGDDGDVDTPDVEVPDVLPDKVMEPEAPMPISNGLYVATNYVGDRSAIAHDVEQIQSYLNEGNVDGAMNLYKNGLNSKIYDENGLWVDKQVRLIQSSIIIFGS